MRIFISERESDINEVEAAIEDVNIILSHVKSGNYDTEWKEGWLMIPINGGKKIKLKHINYNFYLAFNNNSNETGLSLDRHFNIIIYLKGLPLREIQKKLYPILKRLKNDIIHELQHVIDITKSKGYITRKYTQPDINKEKYINQEAEFNAIYKQALAAQLESILESFEKHAKMLEDKEWLDFYDEDLFVIDINYMRSAEVFINGLIDRINYIRRSAVNTKYPLDKHQLKRIKKEDIQHIVF